MSQHYGDMLEVERKNRLRNIRPYLYLKTLDFTNSERTSCRITIVNVGETGFEISVGQKNEKQYYVGTLNVTVMTRNESHVTSLSKILDLKLPFVATFHDIDGNLYKQYFNSDGLGYLSNPPELIKTAIDTVEYDSILRKHTPPAYGTSQPDLSRFY